VRRKGEKKKKKKEEKGVSQASTGRRLEGRKQTEGRVGRRCCVSYNFLSSVLNQEVARLWVPVLYSHMQRDLPLSPLLLSGTAGKEGVLIYRRLWADGWMDITIILW